MRRATTWTIPAVALAALVLIGATVTEPPAGAAAAERSTATPAPINAKLADLAWLAGSWKGKGLGGEIEEHWTAPAAGTMAATFRLTSGDQTRVLEFLLITQEAEHLMLRFKHFTPQYEVWEKDRALEFHCIELTDREVVFHSAVQANPRRMTYTLLAEDRLRVVVQGEEHGKLAAGFAVEFRRAD